MPRRLSEDTLLILWWLWYLPWACAADIARITGLSEQGVSNVLNRRMKAGWLEVALLGRTQDVVKRYVFSTAGVKAVHELCGWTIFWWHAANGVGALARRLEVVEMAYLYLPQLWRSNLVARRHCYVYRERPDFAWQTGEPIVRVELQEADWRRGEMAAFHWMEKKPFDAVVSYSDGLGSDELLHLPVLWRGNFQKAAEMESVWREMGQSFREDNRWARLPLDQALSLEHRPGIVVFSPDRVSGAMAQRHWLESLTKDNATFAAIIDAQGQIVHAMSPPTLRWETFLLPRLDLSLKEVGDVSRVVRALSSGAYAAVNGVRSWRIFRAVDGSPGVTLKQVVESSGVDASVAGRLLEGMVKAEVLAIRGRGKGYYLDTSGRRLLADSQRVTRARTNRRWGVYAEKGGDYLRLQTHHNQGQNDCILFLRRHGFAAFPTMGVVIDYWRNGKLIRVTPDAFVLLPPGVLVAVEFERSATSDDDVKKKADKYVALVEIGCQIPVLFITETVEAAKKLARLRYPFLLATTLEAVREGPHGRAVIQEEVVKGESGCWWYWDKNRDYPTPGVPIDMWSNLYIANSENVVWRLPLDRPFRREKWELVMKDGKIDIV